MISELQRAIGILADDKCTKCGARLRLPCAQIASTEGEPLRLTCRQLHDGRCVPARDWRPRPFDYAALSEGVAERLQHQAGCIHRIYTPTNAAVLDVGWRLAIARQLLGRRLLFAEWLLAEFEWRPQVAMACIGIAERFSSAGELLDRFSLAALCVLSFGWVDDSPLHDALAAARLGEFIDQRRATQLLQLHGVQRPQAIGA